MNLSPPVCVHAFAGGAQSGVVQSFLLSLSGLVMWLSKAEDGDGGGGYL
jgi:hypothetical protein